MQRLSGVVLLAGAVGIGTVLVELVLFGTAPAIPTLFAGVPALILGYFGVKALLAARSGTQLMDERDAYCHRQAGQTAFWVLLAAIMLDDLFGLFPGEHLHTSFIYVGIGTLFVALAYHKYLGTTPFDDPAVCGGGAEGE